jgi:type III pantothenate kinase
LVEPNINLGIKISTDNPAEVGADRIANAVAVSKKYSGAVIVIDFGTATTFDIINSKNEFLGGVISPGLNTQMKCLKNATSKLPKIEVSISSGAIGHNTTDAILSGVIRGSACMVDGLIEQCEAELGEKATIIATGGYCGLIANYLKRPFDKVNPILTLEGLKYIYEMNATRKNSLMF